MTGDGRRSLILNEIAQKGVNLLDQDRLDFVEEAKHLVSGPANEWVWCIRICPKEGYYARFGDADWESHFEFWSDDSEQDSIECWRNGEVVWKQYSREST